MQVTFDKRLSNLPLLKGIERAQQFKGRSKAIVLGARGTMGENIVNSTSKSGTGTLRKDVDLKDLEESKTNIHRTQAKAVKVHKLGGKQQQHINRAGLIGPPIVFKEREPFSKITEAHKKGRAEAEEIVRGFLEGEIIDERVRRDFGEATLLIEAGPELLKFKQDVFEFFDLALKKGAVLASNTSSISITKIAERVDNPENVVGFHFFKPADRNPLVEIIVTEKTSPEVIEAMRQLAYAMNKQPIVVWKDKPGAVANRIYVGVLNEAARIAEEWGVSHDLVDKVFMETFYEKQITAKTKKAKVQFEEAIKLDFFNDEAGIYKKIEALDKQITIAGNKGYKGQKQLEKLFDAKLVLLKTALGELGQKKLYASIVENLSELGSFFKPAERVKDAKGKATEQFKKVNEYLELVKKNRDNLVLPFKIEPYKLTEIKYDKSKDTEKVRADIKGRLLAAYMACATEIVNEDLASPHDIEIACKQGFKWNVGPFELINKLGAQKASDLIRHYLPEQIISAGYGTGIALPDGLTAEEEPSGIKSYIQDGIGFVELGRLHIQNMTQMQNSLSPEMLFGIKQALEELKEKGAKAVVFKDQGGGIFSSGADLNYAQSVIHDREKLKEFVLLGREIMQIIRNYELPTLALIDGPAAGGGAELASACDYRIMVDEESYVMFPEVGLGLIPAWRGTEYFTEIVGEKLAKAIICNTRNPLKAPKLTASDAKEVGFANAVVSRTELYPFLAEVVKGNTEIDLTKKPERKQNFDKDDYSDKIRKKFGMVKEFRHRGGSVSKRRMGRAAERFIDNAHDPLYAQQYMNEEFLDQMGMSFKKASRLQIHFREWAAKSRILAPIFEKVGWL